VVARCSKNGVDWVASRELESKLNTEFWSSSGFPIASTSWYPTTNYCTKSLGWQLRANDNSRKQNRKSEGMLERTRTWGEIDLWFALILSSNNNRSEISKHLSHLANAETRAKRAFLNPRHCITNNDAPSRGPPWQKLLIRYDVYNCLRKVLLMVTLFMKSFIDDYRVLLMFGSTFWTITDNNNILQTLRKL